MKPPKTGELPVIKFSEDKKEKKRKKKNAYKQKCKLAYWYLHEYLKPKYADNVYEYFDNDIDQIIEFGYEMAQDYIQNFVHDPKDELTWDEWAAKKIKELEAKDERRSNVSLWGADIENAPGTPVIYINENADIPDLYWGAFEHYCDLHPVKNQKQAKKRRIKFIKKVNKQYMKTYGHAAKGKIKKHSGFGLIDYMTLSVDKERMLANLKKIAKENAKRSEQMKEELDKWFKHIGGVSKAAQKKILSHSDMVHKSMQNRLHDMVIDIEQNGLPDIPYMTTG